MRQKGCCQSWSRKNGVNTNFNIAGFVKLLRQTSGYGAGLIYSSSCKNYTNPRLLPLRCSLLLISLQKEATHNNHFQPCHLLIPFYLTPPSTKNNLLHNSVISVLPGGEEKKVAHVISSIICWSLQQSNDSLILIYVKRISMWTTWDDSRMMQGTRKKELQVHNNSPECIIIQRILQ